MSDQSSLEQSVSTTNKFDNEASGRQNSAKKEDETKPIESEAAKTRQLPNWLKRSPSNEDVKSDASNSGIAQNEKEKLKKRPKLLF